MNGKYSDFYKTETKNLNVMGRACKSKNRNRNIDKFRRPRELSNSPPLFLFFLGGEGGFPHLPMFLNVGFQIWNLP